MPELLPPSTASGRVWELFMLSATYETHASDKSMQLATWIGWQLTAMLGTFADIA
jgi:hypothetical protein